MAHTLKISDGSTTIDLRGANYGLLWGRWAPKVARRRLDAVGGSGYEEVTETLAITIKGTDEADVLDKLGDLSDLMDQSERWTRGDNVSVVYMEYEPPGSALASSVKAAITGAPGRAPFLQLPGNTDIIITGGRYTLGTKENPVMLSFTRRGLWLGGTETKTSATSTGNPAILTISSAFASDEAIPVPHDLYVQMSNLNSSDDLYIAFANAADKLAIYEAEALGGGNWTSTVVAGASAGSVARVDTGLTHATISTSIGSLDTTVRRAAVYAVFRNNSSTISYEVYAQLSAKGETYQGQKLTVGVSAAEQKPHVKFLGVTSFRRDINDLALAIDITADATVTAGNQLDVDYILLVGIDDSTRVVRNTVGTSERRQYIEHQLEDGLSPRVYDADTVPALEAYSPYVGDPLLLSSGDIVSCLVFGVYSPGSRWVLYYLAELNLNLSVTRTMGYLTPR